LFVFDNKYQHERTNHTIFLVYSTLLGSASAKEFSLNNTRKMMFCNWKVSLISVHLF